MPNAGLDETQAGIEISRKNINNFRYTVNTMAKKESENHSAVSNSL